MQDMKTLRKNTGLHFKRAIDKHFQHLMSEDTETEKYLGVIKVLQEEDLLPMNTRLYGDAVPYVGRTEAVTSVFRDREL